jgi:ATP-dependent DNA helicase RecG
MIPEQVTHLVRGGESLNVEFKGEEKRPLSDRDLVEEAVCLANRSAEELGWLLIGVEDDARITGARPRHEAGITDPLRVQALIANNTRPVLTCRVELLTVEGKAILVIEVPRARSPLGTADGKYLRRAIGGTGQPVCLPYHFHEMQAAQATRGLLDYSALVLPEARWDNLDPLEFERFRRSIRESRGQGDASLLDLPDLELAKALGAVEANHGPTAVRVLGVLLFGREEALRQLLPTHEVAFQVLVGTKVEVNQFFRWPLLRVIEELSTRFRARNREEELMVGLLRIGVPDYPERAFREGVANACQHRDYTRLGAVHVQWHQDRIEISNPGGFPEGVHLGNLLVTPPRPRNPLLTDAFKRAGVVERTGRGIDTIFFEQLRNGRPAPSYQRSTPTDVVLALPGGEANLDFVRAVVEQNQAGRLLGLDELLVLNRLWQARQLTTGEAATLIQKDHADARGVLERLVESGLIEAREAKKARSYHLSASAYTALGEKAGYIRGRGFDAIQQEHMILDYVKTYGRITRRDAAELCRLGPYQGTRLLKKLVAKGLLLQHGQKKGTWYELVK